jgi:hypothetical protein
MNVAVKYVRWLFWSVVYLFRHRPTTVQELMTWAIRTCKPGKFKPHVIRNDRWKGWDVWFENEADYTERRTIEIEAKVSIASGRIVGMQVYDETLERPN